ncbi:MAG: HPr family phosphocarrier protein [Egibacteraceae bacterium]
MSASCDNPPPPAAADVAVRVVVLRKHLHARPAAQVARAAARHHATITLTAGGRRADARSVLAVMSLGATAHTEVRVEATGPDATPAATEIARLLTDPDPDTNSPRIAT